MEARIRLGTSVCAILFFVILAFTGSSGLAAAPDPATDLILVNGKILTVDRNFSIAEAVAIKDGVFIAVGTDREIRGLAGPGTRVVDLRGKTVVPGFTDGHAHMDREGLKYLYPSLEGARSIPDILKIIEREVKNKKPGEWVVTMPVGDPPFYAGVPGILQEKRFPNRWELDSVSPNNPVYILGIWGYWNRPPIVSIANSYALRLAGITKDTVPPYKGITIVKDPATGEPTGVFSENSYVPTVNFSLMKVAPRFTHELRLSALKDSIKRYNAAGTTGTYEGHGISSEVIRAYKELWAKGELTVRSYLVISPTPSKSVRPELEEMVRDWAPYADGSGFGDSMLRIGGLFIQEGGDPDVARLTKQEAPYTEWAAYYYDALSPDKFRDMVYLCAQYGLRVNTIAGDGKSLNAALSLFEEVNKTYPIADKRWVVEHLQEISPEQVQRMKRLGLVATGNAAKHVSISGGARLKRTPKERQAEFTAYRSIMEGGVPLVLATDNVPIEPLKAIWAAVARKDWYTGELLGAAEKLTREQALRAMTINGAYLTFEEQVRGSIEKGKYADLVVLKEDYLTVPEEKIKDIEVLMTIVGGKTVYSKAEFTASREE